MIESIIQRIVSNVGRRIDRSQPLVDARLTDGSRVNAVIAPLAVSGPTLTIRKFPERKMIVDDLITKGALTRGRAHSAWQDEVVRMAKDVDLDVVRVGLDRWEMETALVEFTAERRLRKM